MNDISTRSKYLRGGWLLLIKAVTAILAVFFLEQILNLLLTQDPLGQALLTFHNNYFSFSPYYLTSIDLGSEFSFAPSATFRFGIYVLFGYLIYAVVSILVSLIFKKRKEQINTVLFNTFLILSFLKAFSTPDRKSILKDQEIVITTQTYWFIPSAEHIPYRNIKNVDYMYIPDYDGYNKTYQYYLVITIETNDGRTVTLGEAEVDSQKGTFSKRPKTELSPRLRMMADNAVNLIEQKIHKEKIK